MARNGLIQRVFHLYVDIDELCKQVIGSRGRISVFFTLSTVKSTMRNCIIKARNFNGRNGCRSMKRHVRLLDLDNT